MSRYVINLDRVQRMLARGSESIEILYESCSPFLKVIERGEKTFIHFERNGKDQVDRLEREFMTRLKEKDMLDGEAGSRSSEPTTITLDEEQTKALLYWLDSHRVEDIKDGMEDLGELRPLLRLLDNHSSARRTIR